MEFVIALIIIAIIAGVAWLIAGKLIRKAMAKTEPDQSGRQFSPDATVAENLQGDLRDMQVGGYIRIGIINGFITAVVTYTEGSYTWYEFRMNDGSWLSVEVDDGEMEVFTWEKIISGDLVPNGRQPLTHKGVVYEYEEDGTATYATQGQTDLLSRGVVKYCDYSTSDGAYALSVEYYDGDSTGEVSIGEAQVPSMVEYTPPANN